MDMIERVAEAIRLRSCERGHPVHPAVAHHLAAAAIEAMRDPTEAMVDRCWTDQVIDYPDLCWKSMIDEVLSDQPPKPDIAEGVPGIDNAH